MIQSHLKSIQRFLQQKPWFTVFQQRNLGVTQYWSKSCKIAMIVKKNFVRSWKLYNYVRKQLYYVDLKGPK